MSERYDQRRFDQDRDQDDELESLDPAHQHLLIRTGGNGWLWLIVAFCLLLSLGLRISILRSNVLFSDHDSVSFLTSINTIAGHAPAELEYRSADFLPLYPYTSAAISRVTGLSTEHAAQTASLIMTSCCFVAVLCLTRLYFSNLVVLVAGILWAVLPKLAQIDTAMLTDPMYVSLVYIALFVYERRRAARATIAQSVLLGLLFGLAFLTRSEGMLFLLILPVWHFASLWWEGELTLHWPHAIGWSAVFVIIFGAVVSWHVCR